jgi:hypothetical protein
MNGYRKSIERTVTIPVSLTLLVTLFIILGFVGTSTSAAIDLEAHIIEPGYGTCENPSSVTATDTISTTPPEEVTKLVFVHHSVGNAWLSQWNGELGDELGENNYFVSNTSYEWGPACPTCNGCGGSGSGHIGNCTDIGHWGEWFGNETYLNALYNTDNKPDYPPYTRPADPGGENEIIMFKSCYPNSNLKGNPNNPPTTGDNPLRSEPSWSPYHTVANAKGIYNDILEYFETRQDKLFVVVTAPPVQDNTYAANARAFNNWLVNDWLKDYPHHNVVVFDFYNVLTTNGGSSTVNDLGQDTGNHHRVSSNTIQHITDGDDDDNPNVLEYPTSDNHPSMAGNQKATGEFVPLLNAYYNCWKHGICESSAPPAEMNEKVYLPLVMR